MILCIDAGNTRIKWGLVQSDAWVEQGSFDTHTESIGAQLQYALQSHPRPEMVVACSVASPGVRAAIDAFASGFGVFVHWLTPQERECGVSNSYRDPSQLGADRWAALIGAHSLHEGACLVVTAGTATTIDVLDAAGVFQGGLILPGFDLMREALARGTARLPLAQSDFAALPRSTDEAIVAGCLHAQAGAIERMYRQHIAMQASASCLISGGAALALIPVVEVPLRHVDNLVLEGLKQVAWRASGTQRGAS